MQLNDTLVAATGAMVRKKAARMAWRWRQYGYDIDDLVQIVLTQVHKKRHLYNPKRGKPGAFIRAVMESTLIDLQHHAEAAKRCGKAVNMGDHDVDVRDRSSERQTIDVERRRVVQHVLDGLDEREHEFARVLGEQDGEGVLNAARRLGLTRSVARGIAERIKAKFEESDFFENP